MDFLNHRGSQRGHGGAQSLYKSHPMTGSVRSGYVQSLVDYYHSRILVWSDGGQVRTKSVLERT